MKLLRKRDIPEERYTNAFLGYGPEDSHFVVELTYSELSKYLFMSICQTLYSQFCIIDCNANILLSGNIL